MKLSGVILAVVFCVGAWAGPLGQLELKEGAEPIPGYRLEAKLGVGGFGEVWKARGPSGGSVALKFVRLESFASQQNLSQRNIAAGAETKMNALTMSLEHPHLLKLLNSWAAEGYVIFASEVADGGTLADKHERAFKDGEKTIPAQELVSILIDVAKALDFLNAKTHRFNGTKVSLIHRDVKPANIFFVGGMVKLGDFGWMTHLERYSGKTLFTAGTLGYEAPEIHKKEVNLTTDQYSLALTYASLRLDRLIFDNIPANFDPKYVPGRPDLTGLSPGEQFVIRKALSQSPIDRYPTCGQFMETLDRAVQADLMKSSLSPKSPPPPRKG